MQLLFTLNRKNEKIEKDGKTAMHKQKQEKKTKKPEVNINNNKENDAGSSVKHPRVSTSLINPTESMHDENDGDEMTETDSD